MGFAEGTHRRKGMSKAGPPATELLHGFAVCESNPCFCAKGAGETAEAQSDHLAKGLKRFSAGHSAE